MRQSESELCPPNAGLTALRFCPESVPMRLGLPQKMPLYRQVAATLRQRIKRGDFDRDRRLPTVRQLVTDLGVSHGVAQRALQFLQSQRLVECRPTIGSQLARRNKCESTAFLFGFVQPATDLWAYAMYNHLESTLEDRENLCVMRTSRDDPRREREIIDHLLNNGINGILLLPVDGDTNRAYLSRVTKQVPIVLLDRTVEGLRAPSVVLDYRKLGHDVVAWFAQQGCRRILFLNDPLRISSYAELRQGLREELAARHMEGCLEQMDLPLVETVHSYQQRGENEMMEAFFRATTRRLRQEPFDGLFCPQNELIRLLFVVDRRAEDLLPRLRLATLVGASVDARHWGELRGIGVHFWIGQNAQMLLRGMDLLQEIVMTRRSLQRHVRLRFPMVE